tara:strand:- start:184 stop:525 length:342 start_codon:yes stop_codon:yes gene_type:complete
MYLPFYVPYAAISVQSGVVEEGTILPHTFSSPMNPVALTPVELITQDPCMAIVPSAEVPETPVGDIIDVCSVVTVPRAEVIAETFVTGAPVVGSMLYTKGVFAVPPMPLWFVQ